MFNLKTMAFELATDKSYLELGGGDKPMIRPNADTRMCHDPNGRPTVDAIIDLEKPFTPEHNQGLLDGQFDGIFSKFAFEHVSWRVVPQLLKECHRVIKPGGHLVLVLPNTEAQMRHLLESKDWADGGSMLFGGQDYGENAHKSFFNPDALSAMLAEAGFTHFEWVPFGEKKTDMIAKATRGDGVLPSYGLSFKKMNEALTGAPAPSIYSQAPAPQDGPRTSEPVKIGPLSPAKAPQPVGLTVPTPEQRRSLLGGLPLQAPQPAQGARVELAAAPPEEAAALRTAQRSHFDRRYFDGGSPLGGFDSYWDFPCHELTARQILSLRPTSVLELGPARGYVLKRVLADGVPGVGWEVSEHCYLTRASDVILADATDPDVWAQLEEPIDLCYSVGFFDHLPESLIPHVLAGMAAHTKRGLHGINFKIQEGDKTRLTCRPKEWWQSIMPPGHRVVNKDELESGTYPEDYLRGDGKVKLNLGSFTTMYHNGWVNVDAIDVSQFAAASAYQFLHHDVRQGLPYGTESVDMIYTSHMLEHLTAAEGQSVLKECRRVLKPGGVMRVLVPDAGLLTRLYHEGQLGRFDQLSKTCGEAPDQSAKLYELLMAHHASLYDLDSLGRALKNAHFAAHLWSPESDSGLWGQLHRETVLSLPDLSLCIDVVVPS